MEKLVTNDLLFLQQKLVLLDTERYTKEFAPGYLAIFKQDILYTMGVVLKINIKKSLEE